MSRILITGTSRGIGLETALLLARAGHSVIATMRNPAASPELARITAAESLPIQIETLDVNADDSVQTCMRKVHATGPLDVLVK
ncbi:MAG: SDR family NAD(P)-dependent oxidoreductase [Bryobacterales bacterium]|nr:SDR family NAD(P)-dependent oxidoreductase [Bryobacterales bacterium]